MRTYGRNEDYIHNVRVENGFEPYGDFNDDQTMDSEGRNKAGRKVDLYGDYLFYKGIPPKKIYYCDFCKIDIEPNFSRFNLFLQNNDIRHNTNHYDDNFPVPPQYLYGAKIDPCWCNNMPQFSRSSVGGSKYLLSTHPYTLDPDDLIFESRFESGNLARVVKVTQNYYELYLRPDMYTNRHTQWFYFRVKNTRTKMPYR